MAEWSEQHRENMAALAQDLKRLQTQAQWFAMLVQWELELARRAVVVEERRKHPSFSKTHHGNALATFHVPHLAG